MPSSQSSLQIERYWTGPLLYGVQYGWAAARAFGPGVSVTRYGATMVDAEQALAEALR